MDIFGGSLCSFDFIMLKDYLQHHLFVLFCIWIGIPITFRFSLSLISQIPCQFASHFVARVTSDSFKTSLLNFSISFLQFSILDWISYLELFATFSCSFTKSSEYFRLLKSMTRFHVYSLVNFLCCRADHS